MGKGFGDRLARGGAKAVFPSSEKGVTDEKFADAVKDFDPQTYLRNAEAAEEQARIARADRIAQKEKEREAYEQERERNRNSNVEETGVSGSDAGEAVAS